MPTLEGKRTFKGYIGEPPTDEGQDWIEVVTASSLSLALEALREIKYGYKADDRGQVALMKNRARAVLDQLEEGERPQTASTEGSSE